MVLCFSLSPPPLSALIFSCLSFLPIWSWSWIMAYDLCRFVSLPLDHNLLIDSLSSWCLLTHSCFSTLTFFHGFACFLLLCGLSFNLILFLGFRKGMYWFSVTHFSLYNFDLCIYFFSKCWSAKTLLSCSNRERVRMAYLAVKWKDYFPSCHPEVSGSEKRC